MTLEPVARFQARVLEALRQLRLALGTGVIFYGFDVLLERETGQLRLAPGLAFDGDGRPVALERMVTLPLPNETRPLWLALRHHLIAEADAGDGPGSRRDSVEVVWLTDAPADDHTVPIARLIPGPTGWTVDRSAARRAPGLSHRHTGMVLADRSGRLRYDGTPVRASAAEGGGTGALTQLENAVTAEFAKLDQRLGALEQRLSLAGLEVEELRAEVAETAQRAAGEEDARQALREELSLTLGGEVREELDLLHSELAALAARPATVGGDLGAYTTVRALHGIGDAFASRLREAGIESVADLLAAAANPEARERIEQLGISLDRLRRWGREADLLRLHGAGPAEVALLIAAGVSGSAALATESVDALYERLREQAAARGDVAPPAHAWVASWIEQARQLPPVVEW